MENQDKEKRNLNENKTYDNSKIVKMNENLQNILDVLGEKLFNNIIPGQGVLVNNKNFDTQLNKISKNNPTNICIESEEQYKKRKINSKRNRIRRLNGKKECLEGSVFGMKSDLLEGLMKNQTSTNIGFQSQLNKNKNLPIETNSTREVFSENSLGFELKIGNGNNLRELQLTSIETIYYEIRLKIPISSETYTEISDTVCVQYTKNDKKEKKYGKEPLVSCDSWYDQVNYEVVCYCNHQGLTVNLKDPTLSAINISSQFPINKKNLCKHLIL
jgi:hypothetical protein